ncbi:hypothetical protein ACJW30_04G039300 [Castanea mollissima]
MRQQKFPSPLDQYQYKQASRHTIDKPKYHSLTMPSSTTSHNPFPHFTRSHPNSPVHCFRHLMCILTTPLTFKNRRKLSLRSHHTELNHISINLVSLIRHHFLAKSKQCLNFGTIPNPHIWVFLRCSYPRQACKRGLIKTTLFTTTMA